MKLFKKLRKGFTLIELVVVIAVIAILSAVSVVSYVAITNNAKNTADISAVKQMNTILAGNSVNDLNTINDVFDSFKENGLSGENYRPLYKDRYFFWDSVKNQIVYTDANYQVLFPESLKGSSNKDNWYSLTQEIKKASASEIAEIKTVTPAASTDSGRKEVAYAVSKPEQLFTIGDELKNVMKGEAQSSEFTSTTGNIKYIEQDIVINLTEDVNLMGAAFNFNVKGNFILNGNGHTLSGIVNNKDFCQSDSNKDKTLDQYGTAIVGYAYGASNSNRSNVEFNKVTIKNSQFGNKDAKGAAALVGYTAYANVTFNKVTVDDCDMLALGHSVGGFIGDVQSDCTLTKITLVGENTLKNSRLKVLAEEKTSGTEAYGVGYFIGRETYKGAGTANVKGPVEILASTAADKFVQSNNTKSFPNNTVSAPSGTTYRYWDNATEPTSY